MTKVYPLLMLLLLAVAACTDGDPISQFSKKAKINIENTTHDLPKEGGNLSINIKNIGEVPLNWIAVSDQHWARVVNQSGSEKVPLNIKIDHNHSVTERKAYITIRASNTVNSPQTITIKQEASAPPANVKWAGARSSCYGISPFPSPKQWGKTLHAMQEKYEGSTAAAIWIIGTIDFPETCMLEFPGDDEAYDNISFSDEDKHEPYLQYFDEHNIKVFLQVESAGADMEQLIDIILSRYKHHPCVVGFGVDVEWYREHENKGWGVKVTDAEAQAWEEKVKSFNPDYQLFLKHWDRDWMPPQYRGDISFVIDAQNFDSYNDLAGHHVSYWSDYFYPNDVMFQIGYDKDRKWWQAYRDPAKDVGSQLALSIKADQECGVMWVDFTLKDVLP